MTPSEQWSAQAGDILDALHQTLAQFGCALFQKPEGMVLAEKVNGKWEGIAIVGQVAPEGIDYKPCGRTLRVKFQ